MKLHTASPASNLRKNALITAIPQRLNGEMPSRMNALTLLLRLRQAACDNRLLVNRTPTHPPDNPASTIGAAAARRMQAAVRDDLLRRLQEGDVCAECCDVLEDPLVTTCGHLFCGACLRPRVVEGGAGERELAYRCPLCRAPVTAADVVSPSMLAAVAGVPTTGVLGGAGGTGFSTGGLSGGGQAGHSPGGGDEEDDGPLIIPLALPAARVRPRTKPEEPCNDSVAPLPKPEEPCNDSAAPLPKPEPCNDSAAPLPKAENPCNNPAAPLPQPQNPCNHPGARPPVSADHSLPADGLSTKLRALLNILHDIRAKGMSMLCQHSSLSFPLSLSFPCHSRVCVPQVGAQPTREAPPAAGRATAAAPGRAAGLGARRPSRRAWRSRLCTASGRGCWTSLSRPCNSTSAWLE